MSDKPNGRSRLWRVQVLPLGEIDYHGRPMVLTPEYVAALAIAFNQRAFDLVPFQVADEHTSDPARCRGEAIGFEPVADGLDAVVAVGGEGAVLLREEPSLGAALRIVENYRRTDGRIFPAAINQILGTRSPMLTGLRPWVPVMGAATVQG